MTDTETIAALAAELTRIGKMPEWIAISPSSGVHYKYNAVPKMDGSWQQGQTRLNNDSFALAALSGVAAEVCAENRIIIWDSSDLSGWRVEDGDGNELADDDEPGLPTYHDALIAALKQVEVKK